MNTLSTAPPISEVQAALDACTWVDGAETPLPDRLLLAVARALKVLLGAGTLQDNIGEALKLLGEAAQMHRVKVILPQPCVGGQPPGHALTYERWAQGLASQTSLGVVYFPDDAIQEYLNRMQCGQSVWQLIDEVSSDLRTAFEHVGMRSMGVVPIFAKDRYAGMVAFDDCTGPRRWSHAETEALTIAAHAIGAAIERERIEAARLHAEQARADQAEADSRALRQREGLLQTVTEAARALLIGTDFDTGIHAGMALLGRSLGVIRVALVQDVEAPGDAPLGRWSVTEEWCAAGVPPQIGSVAETGEYPSLDWLHSSRAGEASVIDIPEDDSEFVKGQRGITTASILTVPLFVDGRWWGVMGFDQAHRHRWADYELAVLKTAAACVSAALERERLEAHRLAQAERAASQDRAVLAERNRMARDVHDTLAQGFSAISLQLQAAARAESAEDRARFVARATQEAQANLVESRRTIRLLRGMAEPGETMHALAHVFEDALASRLSGTGLRWRVLPLPEGEMEPALDEEARRELKRIAQEAATNALKHATSPSFEARLSLQPDGTLTVTLEDQGCGFDPQVLADGFGLMGMRERAERIGATLEVESRPGGPTAVVVRLPRFPRKVSK